MATGTGKGRGKVGSRCRGAAAQQRGLATHLKNVVVAWLPICDLTCFALQHQFVLDLAPDTGHRRIIKGVDSLQFDACFVMQLMSSDHGVTHPDGTSSSVVHRPPCTLPLGQDF